MAVGRLGGWAIRRQSGWQTGTMALKRPELCERVCESASLQVAEPVRLLAVEALCAFGGAPIILDTSKDQPTRLLQHCASKQGTSTTPKPTSLQRKRRDEFPSTALGTCLGTQRRHSVSKEPPFPWPTSYVCHDASLFLCDRVMKSAYIWIMDAFHRAKCALGMFPFFVGSRHTHAHTRRA